MTFALAESMVVLPTPSVVAITSIPEEPGMSNPQSCFLSIMRGNHLFGVRHNLRSCPECGPLIRAKQLDNILAQMQGQAIYMLPMPESAGARARQRQDIKLANCEYLRCPDNDGGGITFTTWDAKGKALRISPASLRTMLEAAIQAIPAGQRVSTSRGWTVARSTLRVAQDVEQSEQDTYISTRPPKDLITIAKVIGLPVTRTGRVGWVIGNLDDLTPEEQLEWHHRSGLRLLKRGQIRRLA